MPDAPRLVSAVCLGLIAFIVSGQVMPLLPEGKDFGWFSYINVAIGVICGWTIMGRRAGRGMTAAINNGLAGMAAMVFWALFVQGCYEMVHLAMRNRYDGPVEATSAIFTIGLKYAQFLLAPSILVTLLLGGALAGLASEYAWKRGR